ncbi:MAG: DUF493 domain-containing protein [Sulfurovum sp.]|jgi:putative lipoic acid-binding regulatory protein
MIDLNKHKLELDYPCSWSYKLIVLESTDIHLTVKEVVKKEHCIVESKQSKKGKFKSYNLDLIVHSEDERKEYHKVLGEHKDIKMVL